MMREGHDLPFLSFCMINTIPHRTCFTRSLSNQRPMYSGMPSSWAMSLVHIRECIKAVPAARADLPIRVALEITEPIFEQENERKVVVIRVKRERERPKGEEREGARRVNVMTARMQTIL